MHLFPSVHCNNNKLSPHSLSERSELEWGVKEKKRDSFFSENLRLSYQTKITGVRQENNTVLYWANARINTVSSTRRARKYCFICEPQALEKKKLPRFFFFLSHSNSLRSNMEWDFGAPALRADALQPLVRWVDAPQPAVPWVARQQPKQSPPPKQGCVKLPTVCSPH